ncbi:MAG: hypothetical protein ACQETL_20040, partial [Bacteroidota bacterium]
IRPVFNSLADAVAEEAAKEVNLDEYDKSEFFEKYLQSMAAQHAGYSRGQLLALMDEAESTEEAIELVDQRISEWEQDRAQKLTDRETVKLEGAITREVFTAASVSKIVWVANSDACPICQEMDGKVVGIEDTFMEPNETLLEGEKDFSPSSNILHPPLHNACSCGISSY